MSVSLLFLQTTPLFCLTSNLASGVQDDPEPKRVKIDPEPDKPGPIDLRAKLLARRLDKTGVTDDGVVDDKPKVCNNDDTRRVTRALTRNLNLEEDDDHHDDGEESDDDDYEDMEEDGEYETNSGDNNEDDDEEILLQVDSPLLLYISPSPCTIDFEQIIIEKYWRGLSFVCYGNDYCVLGGGRGGGGDPWI